jgi:hypothetical protein
MVLAQVRLSLVYSRLAFTPGFWSFTFSYSAVVADALAWLALKRPPGDRLRDRGHYPADRIHRVDRRPHGAAGGPRPLPPRVLT